MDADSSLFNVVISHLFAPYWRYHFFDMASYNISDLRHSSTYIFFKKAFSTSNSFRRLISMAFMPPYLERQLQNVLQPILYLRHKSAIGIPCSACLRMLKIWSLIKRIFFIEFSCWYVLAVNLYFQMFLYIGGGTTLSQTIRRRISGPTCCLNIINRQKIMTTLMGLKTAKNVLLFMLYAIIAVSFMKVWFM